MKHIKKKWGIVLSLLLLTGIVLAVFQLPRVLEAEKTTPVIVVIDPGHGGQDGGATHADGTMEKDLNLQFSLRLKEKLEQNGIQVIMTRETDTDTDGVKGFQKKQDLIQRAKIANNSQASAFVSIHMNSSSSPDDLGFQIFYGSFHKDSRVFAEKIRDHVRDANICYRIREVKAVPSSLYVFRTVTLPTVLVECGFLSNAKDRALLKQESFQNAFTDAVCQGILQYLSESKTC